MSRVELPGPYVLNLISHPVPNAGRAGAREGFRDIYDSRSRAKPESVNQRADSGTRERNAVRSDSGRQHRSPGSVQLDALMSRESAAMGVGAGFVRPFDATAVAGQPARLLAAQAALWCWVRRLERRFETAFNCSVERGGGSLRVTIHSHLFDGATFVLGCGRHGWTLTVHTDSVPVFSALTAGADSLTDRFSAAGLGAIGIEIVAGSDQREGLNLFRPDRHSPESQA